MSRRVFRHREATVPLNPQLDTLSDYPFEALRTLLNPVTPVVNDPPILMSLGRAAASAAGPADRDASPPMPMSGTNIRRWPAPPSCGRAIADWLGRAIGSHPAPSIPTITS